MAAAPFGVYGLSQGDPYEVKDSAAKTFREFIHLTRDWCGGRLYCVRARSSEPFL
jgi:hypothetical protein